MKIQSFIHPSRTFLPCSGVGRHINNILLNLQRYSEVNLRLRFSKEWLSEDQLLPLNAPLRNVPFKTFSVNERLLERSWKMTGYPYMDRWFRGANVVYCPIETFIPLKKIPLVVTIHDIQAFETDLPWSDTPQHRMFRRRWAAWLPKVFKHAARVFTVSEYSRQRMIEVFNADPAQIVVVGNGVEEQYFHMAQEVETADELDQYRPYLLVVGGLRYKKGADAILKVADALKEQSSELTLLVAGEEEPSYKEEAAQRDNITILGMVDDTMLAQLYKKAEALLFLSYYEGFGIPALEAMAVGCPTIVSDRGSLPEIAGEAGLLIDPDDTTAVVASIDKILSDQYFKNDIIRKGKMHAKSYTWGKCAERVYQNLSAITQ